MSLSLVLSFISLALKLWGMIKGSSDPVQYMLELGQVMDGVKKAVTPEQKQEAAGKLHDIIAKL